MEKEFMTCYWYDERDGNCWRECPDSILPCPYYGNVDKAECQQFGLKVAIERVEDDGDTTI